MLARSVLALILAIRDRLMGLLTIARARPRRATPVIALVFTLASGATCSWALGSGTPRLAGATVVRAGHRAQLAAMLSGDPSSCRLIASSGRKRVALGDVQPRREHLSFSWT